MGEPLERIVHQLTAESFAALSQIINECGNEEKQVDFVIKQTRDKSVEYISRYVEVMQYVYTRILEALAHYELPTTQLTPDLQLYSTGPYNAGIGIPDSPIARSRLSLTLLQRDGKVFDACQTVGDLVNAVAAEDLVLKKQQSWCGRMAGRVRNMFSYLGMY